ncbi:MAG TPA: polysaccharide pyruvyl transferase family protein, partial [Limnochordales bacterium]
MRKVVLSGYYGFANLGDEAVLAGVLQALRDTRLSVFPLVLSADPDATVRAHGVAAAPRGLAHVPRALRGAAALVSGGGSLLQDVTSFRSPLYYLAVLEMARRAGVPVIWFAQGIGPLRRGWVRRLVARAARQARLVVVRDERSRQELVRMGVPAQQVRVGADAVWLLPAGEAPDVAASGVAGAEPPAEEVARGSPGWRLCVIWRRWPGRAAGDEEVGEALGEALRTWEQA